MSNIRHWVMDFETLPNCFVAVFIGHKTDEKEVFVIHELRNDLEKLIDFLELNQKNKEWHISFNGLSFDSQITEFILNNKALLTFASADEAAGLIAEEAQEVIARSNRKEWAKYPEWKLKIPQIDVFKINHWDNVNKRTSLKWAEYAMDCENVQEMPIHHTTLIHTQEELNMIIDYCTNDVLATKKILHLSVPLIEVRGRIKAKYGLNCYNYSNTKLGSELLLNLYCDATGKNKFEVREYRTRRSSIPIKDIVFPYVKFQSPELIEFLEMLKQKVIINTKSDFNYKLNYRGSTFYYGAGGIHQCIDTGIYEADDDLIIKDLDVASLYPSIACMNGMYPAHLGKEFFEVYKNDIVDVRLAEKAKKENRDMAIIEGFKEAANASYGNSNSEYSWLYDPQYTMQTTINGQLLVTMLVEDLLLHIPGVELLQTNTDGATMRFSKQYLSKYEEICKEWEKKTKLTLEFADYKSMYIWDVNNYIAVYTNGKAKCKGRFEWEDLEKHKYTHLHKNKSFLIIPKAIYNYFVKGIPPERYLIENRNIYDYCAGAKIKGDWIFKSTSVVEGEIIQKTLQKTIRYYISNRGSKIIKVNTKDLREIQLDSGKWMQTDFSKYENLPWSEYNVDDSFYLDAIYQEINNIVKPLSKQTKLLL
jgi:hypothetical protein